MFQLSACAETLFRDLPFEQQVKQIAEAGFLVEFWRWQDHDIDALCKIPGVVISTFSGCMSGSMVDPEGVELFLEGVRTTVGVAKRLGCRQLILLSGEMGPRGEVAHSVASHPATRWTTAYKALRQIAELAEQNGVRYNLEHLNTRLDHVGYPLPQLEDAVQLVAAVGSPNLRVLFDVYHAQVQQGNLIQLIHDYRDYIGYVHVADVPGRHEPGTGEINYPQVAKALRDVGYHGSVGLEAFPQEDDRRALARFREVFS
jgi:hydroxypyruvate isomerase